MTDPLNPGPVTPLEADDDEKLSPDDTRPWWMRLVTSLRPSISQETIVRTGKKADEVGIKGHIDF